LKSVKGTKYERHQPPEEAMETFDSVFQLRSTGISFRLATTAEELL
jgi:hypothetical protein